MEIRLTGRRDPRARRLVTAARAGSAGIAAVAHAIVKVTLPRTR